jgi:RNA polymerase sigma factor (sigma-70 family)
MTAVDERMAGAGRHDSALVVQSLTEPRLFGEIYQRHVDRVHRYLARRIGTALADDLVAETFLAAFRSRHTYDPATGGVLPWLFGIATNLLRHHRRRERAQYRTWQRVGVDPVMVHSHDQAVTDRVAAASLVPRLAGGLARLTAKERDVLLLVVWAGLTYEETAAACGVPIGTVRSRLNRARRRLRAALPSQEV